MFFQHQRLKISVFSEELSFRERLCFLPLYAFYIHSKITNKIDGGYFMCGIAGWIDHSQDMSERIDLLNRMSTANNRCRFVTRTRPMSLSITVNSITQPSFVRSWKHRVFISEVTATRRLCWNRTLNTVRTAAKSWTEFLPLQSTTQATNRCFCAGTESALSRCFTTNTTVACCLRQK